MNMDAIAALIAGGQLKREIATALATIKMAENNLNMAARLIGSVPGSEFLAPLLAETLSDLERIRQKIADAKAPEVGRVAPPAPAQSQISNLKS